VPKHLSHPHDPRLDRLVCLVDLFDLFRPLVWPIEILSPSIPLNKYLLRIKSIIVEVKGQPFRKLFFNSVSLVLKDDRHFGRDGGEAAVHKNRGLSLWHLLIISDRAD
jgi:hypothetical protein